MTYMSSTAQQTHGTDQRVFHFYFDVDPQHAGQEIVRIYNGELSVLDPATHQALALKVATDTQPGWIKSEHGADLFRLPDLDGDGKADYVAFNRSGTIHTPLYAYPSPVDHPTATVHKSGDHIHTSYVVHPDIFSGVKNGKTLQSMKVETHDYTPVYTDEWDVDPNRAGKEKIVIRDRALAENASNVKFYDSAGHAYRPTFDIKREEEGDYIKFPNSIESYKLNFFKGREIADAPLYMTIDGKAYTRFAPLGSYGEYSILGYKIEKAFPNNSNTSMVTTIEGKVSDLRDWTPTIFCQSNTASPVHANP